MVVLDYMSRGDLAKGRRRDGEVWFAMTRSHDKSRRDSSNSISAVAISCRVAVNLKVIAMIEERHADKTKACVIN